jgi:hypothetical protein
LVVLGSACAHDASSTWSDQSKIRRQERKNRVNGRPDFQPSIDELAVSPPAPRTIAGACRIAATPPSGNRIEHADNKCFEGYACPPDHPSPTEFRYALDRMIRLEGTRRLDAAHRPGPHSGSATRNPRKAIQ